MAKTTVAGIISKKENGKEYILLARRNTEPYKSFWSFPGGHIEKYETAEDAMIREIKEEIGLNYYPKFLMNFNEIIPSKKIHAVVSIFTGTVTGELKIFEKEISEVAWFEIQEMFSMNLAFLHNQVLLEYIKSQNSTSKEACFTEYVSLREEILKRMDIRNHLLTFALIVSGAILSYGSTTDASVLVLLIYPILAFFLALGWMHSDVRAGEIGSYIKNNIESKVNGIGWENYISEKKSKQKKQKKSIFIKATEISAAGVFLVTEIVSIVLAIPKIKTSFQDTILLIQVILLLTLDIIAIIYTYKFLRYRRKNLI